MKERITGSIVAVSAVAPDAVLTVRTLRGHAHTLEATD
jgi:hypothetical protein